MTPILVDSPAGTGIRVDDLGMLLKKQRACTVVHDNKDRRQTNSHTQAEAGCRRSLGSPEGFAKAVTKFHRNTNRKSGASGGQSQGKHPNGQGNNSKSSDSLPNSPTSPDPSPPATSTTATITSSSSSLESTQSSGPTSAPKSTPSPTTTDTTDSLSVNSTSIPSNSGTSSDNSTSSSTDASATSSNNSTPVTSTALGSGVVTNSTVPAVTYPSPSVNPPNPSDPTTPTLPEDTDSSAIPKPHNNAGKIAGGIIGGLFVVFLIAMASVWLLRRRRRHLAQLSPDSAFRDSTFTSEQTGTQWSATNSLGHSMMAHNTTHLDGSRFALFDDVSLVGHDSRTFLNVNLPAPYPHQPNRRSWDQISAESGEHMIVMAQTTEEPDMSRPPREEAQKAFASSNVDAVVADIIQTMSSRKRRTLGLE